MAYTEQLPAAQAAEKRELHPAQPADIYTQDDLTRLPVDAPAALEANYIAQEADLGARDFFEGVDDGLERAKQSVENLEIGDIEDLLLKAGLVFTGLHFGARVPRPLRGLVSTLTLGIGTACFGAVALRHLLGKITK